MSMNVFTKKYGMKFATIRYFQTQATDLHLMTGRRIRPYVKSFDTMSARDIAHNVIGAAAVHTQEEMILFLTDKH